MQRAGKIMLYNKNQVAIVPTHATEREHEKIRFITACGR
jgi:hypothetical protein